MNQLTYLVSLKAFFEKDNDYISAFSYIVLQVLSNFPQTNTQIKDKIKTQFLMDMPISFIKTCLKRLKKLGITSADQSVLNEKGMDLTTNVQNKMEEANREVNALIDKIKQFLESKGINASPEEILSTLVKLIEEKTQDLAFGFGNIHIEGAKEKDSQLVKPIVHFLVEVEKKDPISFNTLRDIGQGIILKSILSKKETDNLNTSFSPVDIFIDTNVVLGLLGIEESETVSACKELVALTQQHKNIHLKLFPFTLDECKNFFESNIRSHYSLQHSSYPLRGSRKMLASMDKIDIQMLSASLERKLNKEYGIVVSYDYSKDLYTSDDLIELENVKSEVEMLDNGLFRSRLEHDANAYRWIAALRKHKVHCIEDSKALFLTLDHRLSRWAYSKHQSSRSEVITVEALTAVLWIKKPDMNSLLPLHNLIAGCREKIVIRENVWDAFIKNLKKIKKISEIDGISLLRTHNVLEALEGCNSLSSEEAIFHIQAGEAELKAQEEKRQQEVSDLKKQNSQNEQEKQDYVKTIEYYKNRDQKIAKIIAMILLIISYLFLALLIWIIYNAGWLGKFNGNIGIKVLGLTEVPHTTCLWVLIFFTEGILFKICHDYQAFTKISNWIYNKINKASK
ncbi:hypothetical protein [Candidatus Avelusimicrobium fimicolum]|uniref:hypothetical protein n=1 Tax=Candidatus Avelusimicrobium fimicolum TaxID=3416216 RepID=UPI003D0C5E21